MAWTLALGFSAITQALALVDVAKPASVAAAAAVMRDVATGAGVLMGAETRAGGGSGLGAAACVHARAQVLALLLQRRSVSAGSPAPGAARGGQSPPGGPSPPLRMAAGQLEKALAALWPGAMSSAGNGGPGAHLPPRAERHALIAADVSD